MREYEKTRIMIALRQALPNVFGSNLAYIDPYFPHNTSTTSLILSSL